MGSTESVATSYSTQKRMRKLIGLEKRCWGMGVALRKKKPTVLRFWIYISRAILKRHFSITKSWDD